jgi:hypothetical protein
MGARRKLSKVGSVVLLFFAALILFLAQSAYWVNHTIFNRANFTHIATTSLLSESSRDAIASTVVDKSLEHRPLVKKAVGKEAVSLTSGLLGSDLSSQALSALSDKTYAYTTAKDRQDIKFDLTSIKKPLASVVSVAEDNSIHDVSGDKLSSVQGQIPDEITLVKSDAFPNLSGLVSLMLWVGPVLWLSSFLLFSLYIYLGRAAYAKRVYTVGLVVVTVAALGILTIPFVPAPIAAAIPIIELRPVVENLTSGFLAPFKTQMYDMLGFALLVLLFFNQRFNVLALIKSLEAKLNKPNKHKKL